MVDDRCIGAEVNTVQSGISAVVPQCAIDDVSAALASTSVQASAACDHDDVMIDVRAVMCYVVVFLLIA